MPITPEEQAARAREIASQYANPPAGGFDASVSSALGTAQPKPPTSGSGGFQNFVPLQGAEAEAAQKKLAEYGYAPAPKPAAPQGPPLSQWEASAQNAISGAVGTAQPIRKPPAPPYEMGQVQVTGKATGGGAAGGGGMSWDKSLQVARKMMGLPVDETKYKEALAQQELSMVQAAHVGQETAIKESSYREQYANQMQAMAARHEEQAAQLQQHSESMMTKVAQISDEVRSREIDPSRMWKNMNPMQKALSLISLGMSGYASGRFGTQNTGLQMYQSAMNADIDAQRADIEQGNAKMKDAVGLYGMLRQQGLDDMAATAAAKKVGLDAVEAHMQAEAAGQHSKVIDSNLQQQLAALHVLREKSDRDLNQAINANAARLQVQSNMAAQPALIPKHLREQLDGYSRRLQEQKIPDADQNIKKVREGLTGPNGIGTDAPGLGPFASKVPDTVYRVMLKAGSPSQQVEAKAALDNRRNFSGLKNNLYHALSGAAVSTQEEGRYRKQIDDAMTPEEIHSVTEDIAASVEANRRSIAAAYDPVVLQLYQANGGPVVPGTGSTGAPPVYQPPSLKAGFAGKK